MTEVKLNCYHREHHTPKLGDYYARSSGDVYIITKAGSWANSGYNLVNLKNGELGTSSAGTMENIFGDYADEYSYLEEIEVTSPSMSLGESRQIQCYQEK